MDVISATALRVLVGHPFPAVRMSELVALVGESVDRSLDRRRLKYHLERRPDLFTVLDPLRGPWRQLAAKDRYGREAADPWVLAQSRPASDDHEEPSAALMRDSVRWLGHGVDADSPTEVSRWFAILLAERETRETLFPKAGGTGTQTEGR